jgi:hypothetical protein
LLLLASPEPARWLAAGLATRSAWMAGVVVLGIASYFAALALLGLGPRRLRGAFAGR